MTPPAAAGEERAHASSAPPQALAGEPCILPLAAEIQGEALAFAGDGSGYYTLSEGTGVPLYWYAFLDL